MLKLTLTLLFFRTQLSCKVMLKHIMIYDKDQ